MFQPWQFSISAGAKEFLMLVEEDIAYMTQHRRTRIAKFWDFSIFRKLSFEGFVDIKYMSPTLKQKQRPKDSFLLKT